MTPFCHYNVTSKRCNIAAKPPTKTPSKIYITPTAKAVPVENVYTNIAKQVGDNTFIVIQRNVNMYQNGVTDNISFVPASQILQVIQKWKKTLMNVLEYDTTQYKNEIKIRAEYDQDFSNREFWDELIIYNKSPKNLTGLQ